MSKQEMVCIACPMGCKMEVESIINGSTVYNVSGNKCPRGQEYAVKELTNPTRMVTSTVRIDNGHLARLPVRTSDAIPKNLITECMETLNTVKVKAPIKAGEVVVQKLLGLDIDIIATRSM